MLQYLAFRMHSEGRDAGRALGEHVLIEWLCTYLCQRRRMTPEQAEALVTELVVGSRQRGGLLEERAGLYRFNHLSLQEFLTARYLAEVERNVERIAAFFEAEERLTDAWWRETILLTGGYLHLTASDVATHFIHRLAHLESTHPPRTATALAAAELASATLLEWGSTEATQRTLARRLAALVTDPTLSPALPRLWAATGQALERLGDPRDGVGVRGHVPELAWCSVPAGPFWLGASTKDQEAYDDEKPRRRLTLPAFFVARYLVTNAQFALFIADGGYDNKQWWTEAGWAWRHGSEPEPDLAWLVDQDFRKQYAEWLARRSVARRSTPFFWDYERYNLPNQPVIAHSAPLWNLLILF
jgi:hypothetical protein